MIVRVAELACDLWIFGVPVIAIVWSLLRIAHAAPGRVRYAIAVCGFVAAIVMPCGAFFHVEPASGSVCAGCEARPDPIVEAIRHTAPPLSIAWPAGAILLLLRDAVRHHNLHRQKKIWRPAPDALRSVLGWPERVPLAVADDGSPATVGVIRPRIVLPANLLDLVPEAVAKRIALHELSHRTWRDPLVFALLRAVASLFWIAPVWICLQWARREREVAADEAGLDASDPESYVDALLRLARSARSSDGLALQMAGSDLEFRARRILAMPPKHHSIVFAIFVLIGGVMFARSSSRADLSIPLPGPAPMLEVAIPTPQLAPATVERVRARVVAQRRESLPAGGRSFSPADVQPAAEPPPAVLTLNHVDKHIDVAVHEHVDRHVADIVLKPRSDQTVIRLKSVIRR